MKSARFTSSSSDQETVIWANCSFVPCICYRVVHSLEALGVSQPTTLLFRSDNGTERVRVQLDTDALVFKGDGGIGQPFPLTLRAG